LAVKACGPTAATLAAFASLMDAAPCVSPTAQTFTRPSDDATLSTIELKMARAAGITPEQMLAAKRGTTK
jgi:hypothetical protein